MKLRCIWERERERESHSLYAFSIKVYWNRFIVCELFNIKIYWERVKVYEIFYVKRQGERERESVCLKLKLYIRYWESLLLTCCKSLSVEMFFFWSLFSLYALFIIFITFVYNKLCKILMFSILCYQLKLNIFQVKLFLGMKWNNVI